MKFAAVLGSIAVVLLFVSMVESVGKYDFLDFIDPCPRKDPNVTLCLKNSIQTFIEKLRHGLPKLGFPEVEPLIIPRLDFRVNELLYAFDSHFTDVVATGVSQLALTGLKTKTLPMRTLLHMNFTLDEIKVTAKVKSNGTIATLSADKGGDFKGTFKGIDANVFLGTWTVERNGIKYFEPKSVKIDYTVKDGSNIEVVNTGELFEFANNIALRTQWKGLSDAMKPELIKAFVPMIKQFATKIFAKTPYDAWIADDKPNRPVKPPHVRPPKAGKR